MARAFTDWLEGGMPLSDATTRAIADTALLIVDALAPEPLSASTRARLFERALAGPSHPPAPWAPVRRTLEQVPGPAWLGLGGAAAGLVIGVVLLRLREAEPA
ncbi:MAG TPA: hypothetical protein VMW47_01620 [Verrucomicrobiae bacterium]|nr:hypothetical protein [Verrucomicrobiae bacterium]